MVPKELNMSNKLNERINSYQELTDFKLLNRLPIVICVNGRNFAKLTSLLDKPYCSKLADGMFVTMLKLCTEVDGTIFAYQYNDEIVMIVRNDQTLETESWYDNRIQKICSVTSSIATLQFRNYLESTELTYTGEPVFTSQVFAVPNIMEAINTIVYKQQQNFHTSIQLACFYELLKKYDKNAIKDMLHGLNVDEKVDLLKQECDVNYNEYPHSFRRGAGCYKVPKVVNDGTMKNKWFVNPELPIFTKDQSFLSNIFKNGSDIFRKESF